ncbi:MAG: type IV pilus modification protein PilV [Gammaproteobacteria bacterium]|nr:type IV pilus modification protein PilV [Gammaproteobacteria bacterium]MDH3469588.1 type IV pilus modification protein PilV [Gammaproteobacteria bacterium]
MQALTNSKRYSKGTSLVEVLVAVFVFSIGLLGIAALQVQSKRSNFEAIQRTTASMLTNDLVERLRSNTAGLNTYITDANLPLGGGQIATEPAPNCFSATCTTVELATHDLWEWEQSIDGATEVQAGAQTGGLVSPTGCVTGPVGGGTGEYTVAIAWRGTSELADTGALKDPCGQGSGKYDGPGGADVFRRVLALPVYIEGG